MKKLLTQTELLIGLQKLIKVGLDDYSLVNGIFGSESLDHLNASIKEALNPSKGLKERSEIIDAEEYLCRKNKL